MSNRPFFERMNVDFTSDDPPSPGPLMRGKPLGDGGPRDLFANYRRMNAFGDYMGGYGSDGPINPRRMGPMNRFGDGPSMNRFSDGPSMNRFSDGPMNRFSDGPSMNRFGDRPMNRMGRGFMDMDPDEMDMMGPGPMNMRGPGPMNMRGPGPMNARGFGPMRRMMPMDDMMDDFDAPPFMERPAPGPMRGRGPPRDNPVSFLIRCGVPEDRMQDFPRAYFDMIEADHCSICDFSFDSFIMSKMHYISKNHWKHSKKWLNDWAGYPVGNTNQIQLKSRDLYCELCDIQITSRTHADSHYSGKAHQAVVDGRRNPKNIVLMDDEERFEALVRRERKHLRNLKQKLKDAEPAKKEEPKKEDAKPIDPSLYCDVCNTGVTCSEQMTAHLNGKRHLQKEKNHILRMMKGGGSQMISDPSDQTNDHENGGQAGENEDDDQEGFVE